VVREALTPGGVVGHAERGDAVGALGVEDVAVLRVGDVAVGAAAGEALEDLARDGARVGGRGAVLRQHHRAARHQRVQDRHPRARPPLLPRGGWPGLLCRVDSGERRGEEEKGRTGWARLGRDGDGGHAELAGWLPIGCGGVGTRDPFVN